MLSVPSRTRLGLIGTRSSHLMGRMFSIYLSPPQTPSTSSTFKTQLSCLRFNTQHAFEKTKIKIKSAKWRIQNIDMVTLTLKYIMGGLISLGLED